MIYKPKQKDFITMNNNDRLANTALKEQDNEPV